MVAQTGISSAPRRNIDDARQAIGLYCYIAFENGQLSAGSGWNDDEERAYFLLVCPGCGMFDGAQLTPKDDGSIKAECREMSGCTPQLLGKRFKELAGLKLSRTPTPRVKAKDMPNGQLPDEWQSNPNGDAWRMIREYGSRLVVVEGLSEYPVAYVLDTDTGLWQADKSPLTALFAETSKVWGGKAGEIAVNGGVYIDGIDNSSTSHHVTRENALALLRYLGSHRDATAVHKCEQVLGGVIREMAARGVDHGALYVNATELDYDGRYLGCANGVVDLDTGELLDAADGAEKLITRSTGIPYTPGARHPAIDGLLDHLPRVERDYLLDAAAYSLRGNPARRWYVISGPAGSGKTTFLRAVGAALGKAGKRRGYAFGLKEGALLKDRARNADGHTDRLKHFHDGRFAYSSELPTGGAGFNEGLLKTLSGGDDLEVRRMYREAEESRPARATLFLAVNPKDLDRLSLVDTALHERTAILQWPSFPTATVKDVDRVETVTRVPAAEAMLAILIDRCRRLKAPPPIPASVASATADRRRESIGLLGQWLEKRVRITGNRRDYMLPEDLWKEAYEDLGNSEEGKIAGYDRKGMLALLREVYPSLPSQRPKKIPGSQMVKRVYHGVKLLAAEDVEDVLVCRLCDGPPNGPELSEDGLCAKCLLDVESGRKWIELGFLPVWDSVPPEARGNTLGTPPDSSYAFLEGAYQALRDAVGDNRLPEEQIPLLEPMVVD